MKKNHPLIDLQLEEPESSSDDFSLESILAEFGSASQQKTPNPTHSEQAESMTAESQPTSEKTTTPSEPQPTVSEMPQPQPQPIVEEIAQPTEPQPIAEKIAQPTEPQPIAEKIAQPTEPQPTTPEMPPITEPAAPATVPEPKPAEVKPAKPVRAEDLVVPRAIPMDHVIDTAAFDSVYEKKQRRIQKLRKQLLAEQAAAPRTAERRSKKNLRPAHIKTGPVPVPPVAKAEMARERAEKPVGQRYPRPTPVKKKAPEKPPEKPKPSLNPLQMLRKFERNRRSATTRFWLVLIPCVALFYMAAAAYLELPLHAALDFAENPRSAALVHTVLLGCVMALNWDTLARGIVGLFLLRAGSDTLTATSLCVSEAYCIANIISPDICRDASGAVAYVPISVLPALAALFALLSSKIRYQAYYRSVRSCYRLRNAKTLTTLPEKYDGDVIYTVAKADNYQGFYRTFAENDTASTVMLWYTPLVLLASLFLAVYCGYSTQNSAPFLWCWSIIVGFTPALGIPLAAVLPLTRAAKRLYKNGILVGGGKSIERMAKRSFVLMTDEDVFPGDAISINGYKLMNPDKKELALSAAASLLEAAQTALAVPFVRLAGENYAPVRPVKNLSFSDAGGISGTMDGQQVLIGNASYVQRAWVKIPPDIKLKTAVFCVVDSELLAVFAVRYQVTPKADYALNLLEDHGYLPVVAARDFNVTASFLQSRFGVASSDLVYPPAELRVTMSDPALKLDADGLIVTYGGGDAVAEALVTCRRCRTSTRLSLLFSLLSSVIGLLLGVLMAYFGWSEAATPVNMLTYYLLWMVPSLVFAAWVNRF